MGGLFGLSIVSALGWLRLKLRFARFVSGVQAGVRRLTEPVAWRVSCVLLCKKTGGLFDEYPES